MCTSVYTRPGRAVADGATQGWGTRAQINARTWANVPTNPRRHRLPGPQKPASMHPDPLCSKESPRGRGFGPRACSDPSMSRILNPVRVSRLLLSSLLVKRRDLQPFWLVFLSHKLPPLRVSAHAVPCDSNTLIPPLSNSYSLSTAEMSPFEETLHAYPKLDCFCLLMCFPNNLYFP